MKADLSRGHRPDRKRDKAYNRVLLQQGRLLLDSDVAALSDALSGQVHGLGQEAVGEAGSTDFGFLVTPGPLLARFDTLGAVTKDGTSHALFRHHLDHGRKYLDRLPSLYLDGKLGWGKVSVALRAPVTPGGKVRLWGRFPAGTSLVVDIPGALTTPVTVAGTDATVFKPYDITLNAGSYTAQTLTLAFANTASSDPTREAWLGLIETYHSANNEPSFWIHKGRYRIGGLSFELKQDGRFPVASFPSYYSGLQMFSPQAGTNGLRFVAYLEGWERLITPVEDPGLLEQALGGTLDTSVRTRGVGQVKLARCDDGGTLTPEQLLAAFRKVKLPTGTLTISTTAQATAQDPCAIPEVEGYTGGDNRLYRFEVHDGGSLSTFSIKWSRNNGAESFRIVKWTTTTVTRLELAAGSDLKDGDLVEVVDESVELGDRTHATLDAAGFTPAVRATGPLYFVRNVADAPGQVELLNTAGNPVVITTNLMTAAPPSKLRRWHGLLKPADGAVQGDGSLTYTVDGIEVRLAGPAGGTDLFRQGDYWQYEARKLYANDNGPWVATPHGPDRFMAPLALLKFNGTTVPVELLRWYSGQFSPLADMGADDVAFDGNRAGSPSNTVQAALDELFLRQGSGAGGHAEMFPEANPTDDAARLLTLIQTKLPKGGVIDLRPGVYYFRSRLVLSAMNLELRGAPEAVIVFETGSQTALAPTTGTTLTLTGLTLFCKGAAPALVDCLVDASLKVRECALIHVGVSGAPGSAILANNGTPTLSTIDKATYAAAYPLAEAMSVASAPKVQVEDSIIVAGWGVGAPNLEFLGMRDTVCWCGSGVVSVLQELGRADVSGSVLATDMPFTTFNNIRAQDPGAVTQYVRGVLEAMVPTANPSGTAFYTRDLYGGSVRDSSFYGALGFFGQLVRGVVFEGNSYGGRNGVRLDNVTETRLIGEHIDVTGTGSVEQPLGIVIPRSAIDVAIADCSISAENVSTGSSNKVIYGAGLSLATRWTLTENQARRFSGLLVHDNFIRATGACIVFRKSSDIDSATDTPDRVLFRGNHLEQIGLYGMLCRPANPLPVRPASVVISDNLIEMPSPTNFLTPYYGMELSQASVRLTGNTFQGRGGISNGSTFVIYLNNSQNCVIDGNTFVLAGDNAAGSGLGMLIGVNAFYSSGLRLTRNTFQCSANTRAVYAVGCDEILVDRNDFGTAWSGVQIQDGTNPVIRGNKAQCPVIIQAVVGSQGVVAENHLSYGGVDTAGLSNIYVGSAAGPHLLIENISGQWQIENNRVIDRWLIVRPRYNASVEDNCILHVVGNLSGTLIVGGFNPNTGSFFVTPGTLSKVIITGNLASNGYLRANTYSNQRFVMTSNLAVNVFHGTTDVGAATISPAYNRDAS